MMKTEPRIVELEEGWQALIGRSDTENDHLTFQVAFPQDLWLHAKGCPGSHVILQHPREHNPPKSVLEAAGILALVHSKARNAKSSAVSVARICDLSKPKGAPAGQVQLRKSKTLKLTLPPKSGS